VLEYTWLKMGRPYYNLWPSVVEPFGRLNTDGLKTSDLYSEFLSIAVRFPDNETSIKCDEMRIKSLLIGCFNSQSLKKALFFTAYGSRLDGSSSYGSMNGYLSLESDNFNEYITKSVETVHDDTEFYGSTLMRILLSVILLSKHPDEKLVTPDVLTDDRAKWLDTKDEKYVEKARRRGKNGWDIGRDIEFAPHWRRPHAALYHTGKGRSIPKIVFRNGALVKREKMLEVPTGFLDDEESIPEGGTP